MNAATTGSIEDLLRASAAMHRHLCPRQVLGVRMGLLAGDLLGIALPQRDKRLIAILETDGCTVDGVAVATGCSVGRRTLRVEDLGKVAATFADSTTGRSVRIVPRDGIRALARAFAPDAATRWEAQLRGYRDMPAELLLRWQPVTLVTPIAVLVSKPGARATCQACGEEIINEREVVREGTVLCRTCAGLRYYLPPPQIEDAAPAARTAIWP